jgi:hypothetical protein
MHFSKEFEAFALLLMREMPVSKAAAMVGETDTRLWRMLFRQVDAAYAEADFSNVCCVGVDEMSVRKGHEYISVFADLVRKRVRFATEGKDHAVWLKFVEAFEKHNGHRHAITQVSMDMSPAYQKGVPTMNKMREHLKAAGIAYVDDLDKRLDFHALRMTFDTNLGVAEVSDAVRMKLMRHKSARMTLETYTDADKVPVTGALARLPEFGYSANSKQDTGKDTEILVQGGQTASKPVTGESDLNGEKPLVNKGQSHGLTLLGIPCLKESNGGERGIRTPETNQILA